MEEQLVSFETAKLAKEKGFNVKCRKKYTTRLFPFLNPKYGAPTQSLLQKWLRDEHDIWVLVDFAYDTSELAACVQKGNRQLLVDGFTMVESYEEALEKGLQEALKLI